MATIHVNSLPSGTSSTAAERLASLQRILQKQVALRLRRLEERSKEVEIEAEAEIVVDAETDDPETLLRAEASGSVRRAALTRVDEVAALLERATGRGVTARHLQTGWGPVDDTLGGGLRRGAVHEWFGQWNDVSPSQESRGRASSRASRAPWVAPIGALIHLAHQALRQAKGDAAMVLWIGRSCWPSLMHLTHIGDLLRCSVLIDEASGRDLVGQRLWAIDLALRSPSVAVVVADGSGLDLAATRRLQLAAEHAESALALLARPPVERSLLSAAMTRWSVAPTCHGDGRSMGVRIELLRRKGLRPTCATGAGVSAWSLEHDDATGDLRMAAGLVGGSAAPTDVQRSVG